MNFSHDRILTAVAEKVETGERLSFADGLALFATDDLPALGKLADTVRRRKHGRTTFFNVNRHLNPTNVCYVDCKFCGFYRTPRQPDAYTHNIEDSLRVAGEAVKEGATELHITGGLNTKLPFSYFTDLLSGLKQNYPQLHLKAFTMVELDHLVRTCRMTDEEVIEGLIAAGSSRMTHRIPMAPSTFCSDPSSALLSDENSFFINVWAFVCSFRFLWKMVHLS